MSTTQQPEALRLADALERPGYGWHSTPAQCAAELRRLHAENTMLQGGYDAARLEIESLRARSVVPAVREAVAKAIYDQWVYKDGWVAWVNGGNSLRQDDARRLADLAFAMAQAAPAAVAGPSDAEPLHITHGPLMRHAAYLLRSRKPALPEHESVAGELELAADGHPTPAGEPSSEWLEVAEAAMLAAAPTTQPAPQQGTGKVVHQFRKQHCAEWYDGHADHSDGRGPYEERTLYTPPSPASQGDALDAEQHEMDARHAAIYRWMLSHVADVLSIFDNWFEDEEADTDELHDALAARAAQEGK